MSMILIIIYVDRRQFYEIRMYFFERKIQHYFWQAIRKINMSSNEERSIFISIWN